MKHRIALLCALLSLSGSLLIAQTASVSEGCAPLEVSFTAPGGAASFFWDFQNGATSTQANPENTFVNPGTYEVAFSEGQGQPVLGTVTVTVYARPEPDITLDPTEGCTPLEVSFADNSTIPDGVTVNNYVWTFGDGASAEGVTDPVHTYTTGGNFDVSLSLESNLENCSVTQIFDDAVSASSPANVAFTTTPNPPFACEPPLTVGFGNQSSGGGPGLTFTWDFGNGETFTGVNPPAQTYTELGNYTVTLTATDDNGCEASFSRTVRVGPPRAQFIIPDTVCVLDSIVIQNTSDPGVYSWNFGPGASPQTSTAVNPGVRFLSEGTYDITLTVNNAQGCQGDTVITVYADQADAGFASDPAFSCTTPVTFTYDPLSDEAVEFLWIFSDGSTSEEENPSYTYFNPDTLTYSENQLRFNPVTLIVTNASGCRDTLVQSDSIFVPNARFMPDRVDGCAPLTVIFSDSSRSSHPIELWEWDLGDGTTFTQTEEEDIAHIYTEPGEYDVQLTITNELGCMDTSFVITIRVGEELPIDLLADQTQICPGDTVSFTGVGDTSLIDAWHIQTEDGRSFHCFQDQSPSWPVGDITGPTDVTITAEYNGCLSTLTKEDFVDISGPIARIDYEIDCEAPFDVTFRDSSLEATSLLWDFGDTTTATTGGEFIHTYEEAGDYWVTLTAENANTGCPASVDSVLVCVRDVQADFTLPEQVCQSQQYQLDASASIGVDADCWKGYDWFFEISNRPITTQDAAIDFTFPNSGPEGMPADETVTLVVTDINGCTDTTSRDTRVYGIVPDFTFDDARICFPAEVSFTDLSVGDTTITSWNWSFGSTEPSPTTILNGGAAPGDSLEIILELEDALGCPASATGFIEVYAPVSNIIADPFPANLCAGDMLAVTATDFTAEGSSLSFEWNFGNGQTADTQSATATYPEAGQFNTILTFTEIATGCTGQTQLPVSVQDYPEAAFISNVDDEPVICYPAQIAFEDMSQSATPLSYTWDFGNGQNGVGPAPTASFGKGTFEIQLIAATTNGCADTSSRSFTLIGPEGSFEIEPDQVCLGDELTFTLQDTVDVSSFTWNFGDGTELDDVDPATHTYTFLPPGGQTVATLVLRGANDACEIAVERPVPIRQVTADFLRQNGQDSTLCAGVDYLFQNTSTGADSFLWTFGNGETATSTADSVFTVYNENGNYTVQLIATESVLGCADTIQKVVLINPLPELNVPGDSICRGDSLTLRVLNPPVGAVYTWTSPDDPGFGTVEEPAPEVVFDEKGVFTYEVMVIDEQGCEASTSTVIIVDPCIDFAMPNAFTPNEDGDNDFFNFVTNGLIDAGDYEVLTFEIYNRWGNKVYDNDNPAQGWDGTFNGNESPSDVYLYKVEIRIDNERMERRVFTGEVVLLR